MKEVLRVVLSRQSLYCMYTMRIALTFAEQGVEIPATAPQATFFISSDLAPFTFTSTFFL